MLSARGSEPADDDGLAIFLEHADLGEHIGDNSGGVLDRRQIRITVGGYGSCL
jgi:hypothetical protein